MYWTLSFFGIFVFLYFFGSRVGIVAKYLYVREESELYPKIERKDRIDQKGPTATIIIYIIRLVLEDAEKN